MRGDRGNLDLVWSHPPHSCPGGCVKPQVLQKGYQQTKEFTKGRACFFFFVKTWINIMLKSPKMPKTYHELIQYLAIYVVKFITTKVII